MGLCSANASSTVSHRLPVRGLDDGHARRLRVEGIGGQFLRRRGLHGWFGYRCREDAVRVSDHLVSRQDQGEHAIEPGKADSGHAIGVDILVPTARAASAWLPSCRAARPSACGGQRLTFLRHSDVAEAAAFAISHPRLGTVKATSLRITLSLFAFGGRRLYQVIGIN